MLFWAVDNPAPANYLLISGDRDFSNALHQLRMRRYNILLAQPKTASAALVAAAKNVWLWTSLLAGGQPLPECELHKLGSKNYTSSPGTTQIPVSGAAQMREPVDSYSEKPYVANQNSPSTSRRDRGRANTIQRNPSQTNASKTTNTPFYPSAPPPMPARPNGTSSTSAPSTRVAAFGSWNNFRHPVSSCSQRRNAGLEHDPKKKSKGFCAGKRPEPSKNKKKPEGENSKGSCARRGAEVKHDPQKKPRSENKKKPEGGNSKGSCGGKGPELKPDPSKKPEGENKKVASARKGVSMKKPVVPRSKGHVSVTKQDKGKKKPPAAKARVRK